MLFIEHVEDWQEAKQAACAIDEILFWPETIEGWPFWAQVFMALNHHVDHFNKMVYKFGMVVDPFNCQGSVGDGRKPDHKKQEYDVECFCEPLTKAFDFADKPEPCRFWHEVAVRFAANCNHNDLETAQQVVDPFFPVPQEPEGPVIQPITYRVKKRQLRSAQ